MQQETNIKRLGRSDLKEFFKNGKIPSENHYAALIESMINQQDDGFSKDDDEGFVIASGGDSDRLVSFYKNMDAIKPFFTIKKDDDSIAGLCFQPLNESAIAEDSQDISSHVFFHNNGTVGIGKKSDNKYKVDINGFVAAEGRIGTYKDLKIGNNVPANGKWHPITGELDNCQAFEVIARTGVKNSRKFAMTHAIAVKAFGKSRGKVRMVSAHYGFLWNRISVKWILNKENEKFTLNIRTHRHYGNDVNIYFQITKLWDDAMFLPDNYYY